MEFEPIDLSKIKGKGVLSDDIRNEQIRVNCALVRNRLKVRLDNPHRRVAIVMCYGPSLEDTWTHAVAEREECKAAGYGADLVSVSGAHDYLMERGVIPRFHVECDPRKHKAGMLTRPHRDVEYLMASCVHPDIIKRLVARGRKVRLWHMNNGASTMPKDRHDTLIGGGGSVGLRSIPLLMAMGYRRFIIHGMDCSFREKSHAGHHTGKEVKRVLVRCGDREFETSPALLSYLKSFDDLRKHIGNPDVDPMKIEIVLRGDGLLRHSLNVGGAAIPIDTEQKEAA